MHSVPRLFWPVLGALGIIGSAVALVIDAHNTLAVYLAAATAAGAVPVGAMMVLMVTYLVRGQWSDLMHVPLTAAALLIPVAGLLFLPVLVGMPWLYPWAKGIHAGAFQGTYLTPWFFALRTVVYFAVWTVLALWLRSAWPDPVRMTRAASAGLIVYALLGTLAGVDWFESLSPSFHSSEYGLLFLTFQMLAGLSFAIVMATAAYPRESVESGFGPLLLAALLLWAYVQGMQYIIIWSGDIPDEVVWYIKRESGGWMFVTWAMVLLQFVVPFFAMLSDRVRNRAGPVMAIAGATLALRFVEAMEAVLPSADADGAILWLAVPATLAMTIGLLGWALQVTLVRMERSPADMAALAAAGRSA